MNILSFDLFLFDFDGLLVNTELLHYEAYDKMLRNRGFDWNWSFKEYAVFAHESTKALGEAVYARCPGLRDLESDWMKLREEKQAIYIKLIEEGHLELMPGVVDLLTLLEKKNLSRAVVTNSPKEHIDLIKELLPILKTIPLWVTREYYKGAKPLPDGYLKALEITGISADRAVGFEDSSKGALALISANIKPIFVIPDFYPKPDLTHPSLKRISSLEELTSAYSH